MTTLDALQQTIAPELQRLNRRISDSLTSSNALMNNVVEGYLKHKGKQIRPILVVLSARLLGEVNEKVINAGAAVEMLHNASLIHDDVVDETKIRRGNETINAMWDNHIAVLVGDFFVSSALQRAIDTGDIRIVNSIASLGRLLSLGEIDQIYNARYHTLDENAYFEIISRKTASLFVACVEMGGYAVGADDTRIAALRRFAEDLGLCFQIKDDIFDYFSDAKIGKPTGNDLREGKITLPLLHALTAAPLPERQEMAELARREELDAEAIDTLIDFAKRAGGIDYAYGRMAALRDNAVKALREAFPDAPSQVDDFVAIFDYIITRDK